MATPILLHHALDGALGPILVDVRTTSPAVPRPAVLIMHGFKGFKDYAFGPVIAERLARAGFTAITLSVSGAGVDAAGDFVYPERFARNSYSREFADLELVIDVLARGALGVASPTSIGLIGHSRGGGVALCVARETPRVDAVVTWAAIATIRRYTDAQVHAWRRAGRITTENTRTGQQLPMDFEIVDDALAHPDRFDIEQAAATLQRPWLMIHGRSDETVPVAEGERLAALATDPRAESLFIDGGTHTFGAKHPWAGPTRETEQLFNATVAFLSRHLA